MTEQLALFERLLDCLESGVGCALCTVVNTRGSTPQTAGAMLLLHPDGQAQGTIGGGCVEAEVRRRALKMLDSQSSGLLSLVLDHDYGWDDGLICGGRLDVAVVCVTDAAGAGPFREVVERIRRQETAHLDLRLPHEGKTIEYRVNIEPTPTLLIAGAGHIGAALARLATELNFRVVVIDDRSDLLDRKRLPEPIESVAGDIEGTLRDWPIDGATYVVIVTRGHSHDEQALSAVSGSSAKYIGMIGSRRKIRIVFEDLENRGIDRAKLDKVHTPIGLDIGAVTVPEIAVSIAAELIQIRRADAFKAVEGPVESDQPRL